MPAGTSPDSAVNRRPRGTDAERSRLRDLLYRKLGLWVGEERNADLDAALSRCGTELRQELPAVLALLEGERLGRESVAGLLAPICGQSASLVRDTRELVAFHGGFEEHLASRASLRGDTALRVWCLDGGSGFEPFRMAILLEAWRTDREDRLPIRIVASDATLDALRACRERTWSSEDLAGLAPRTLATAFEAVGNEWRIGAWADETITLAPLDPERIGEAEGLGSFDVVFARHVLCLLMPEARERLIGLVLERLHAGGLLFLGRGESPGPRGGPLRLVLYPGGAVYRKPLRP